MAKLKQFPILPKTVYEYSEETARGRLAGDTVWACAFEFNMKKSALGLSQEPVEGILTYTDYEFSNKQYSQMPNPHAKKPRYFVPRNKKGTGYCWSAAVAIESRAYADTEAECRKLYKTMIHDWQEWFESCADLCRTYL